MAHNPPREWISDEQLRAVSAAASRKRAQWVDLQDLADKMLSQAAQGKRVVLSPATADYLARWVKDRMGSP
ncbi:hypothetical protein [Aquamicrobium soli]|uniref:CopG family transcriptional regulator n=1 Tax=Aquamicrobium soli TaxID=1811518 RepID=A0ABV7KEZ0_9HYPH